MSWPAMAFDLDYRGTYEQVCGLFYDRALPWPIWAVERQYLDSWEGFLMAVIFSVCSANSEFFL